MVEARTLQSWADEADVSVEAVESLARFALTKSSVTHQVLLARFRRRELLRTYLHDIRRRPECQ